MVAIARNKATGACTSLYVTRRNSTTGLTSVPSGAIFCLGDQDDDLEIMYDTDVRAACGSTGTFFPINYAGNTLTTYLGDGNDHFHGGSGTDVVHGDSGNDDIWTASGNNEVLKGWNSQDALFCTGGTDTCDGGTGQDELYEDTNSGGDIFLGGTNSDVVFACQPTSIDCGGNAGDEAYTSGPLPRSNVRRCETAEIACN